MRKNLTEEEEMFEELEKELAKLGSCSEITSLGQFYELCKEESKKGEEFNDFIKSDSFTAPVKNRSLTLADMVSRDFQEIEEVKEGDTTYQEFVKNWFKEHPEAKPGTPETMKEIAKEWEKYKKGTDLRNIYQEDQPILFEPAHPSGTRGKQFPVEVPQQEISTKKESLKELVERYGWEKAEQLLKERILEEKKAQEQPLSNKMHEEFSKIEPGKEVKTIEPYREQDISKGVEPGKYKEVEKLAQGGGEGQQPLPEETRKEFEKITPGKVVNIKDLPEGKVHEYFKSITPGKTYEKPYEGEGIKLGQFAPGTRVRHVKDPTSSGIVRETKTERGERLYLVLWTGAPTVPGVGTLPAESWVSEKDLMAVTASKKISISLK